MFSLTTLQHNYLYIVNFNNIVHTVIKLIVRNEKLRLNVYHTTHYTYTGLFANRAQYSLAFLRLMIKLFSNICKFGIFKNLDAWPSLKF